MKKRLFAILFTAILILATVLPVSAEDEMPSERLLPRLVDEADLLTDEEEAELLSKLDEISERQQCDVAVVTVNSLDGKSAMEYADDFYDYNGYGFGEEKDGILFLVSMEDRDWYISTCGYGITAFTDDNLDYMEEEFLPMLSDGDYSGAFDKYAELCDDFITQAKSEEEDISNGAVLVFWLFPDLLIGFVIAFIVALIKKSSLKSVAKKSQAQDYTVPGSMVLTTNRDHLVNKTVTTRKIEKSNSSGGSTTHTSSSGRTHGGKGGKF